jgi:aspartokinase-like uncharacterized kinase
LNNSSGETVADSAPSPTSACWVFKLGGSLLNLPDLANRLRAVIRSISTKPLLVVGGGATADVVRGWDQSHHLDSASAHWLAIRAMDFNQYLIETLLPEAVGVAHPDEADPVWRQSGIAVLNALEWLRMEEGQPDSLPHSWDVTSDSIAARVSLRWQAQGLVLLKSRDAPQTITRLDETGEGLVDGYFHQLAPKLPQIAWCNLRSRALAVVTCQGE